MKKVNSTVGYDSYMDKEVSIVEGSFYNGHMTITNVPFMLCGGKKQLSASSMKRIAFITQYMQDKGLQEFDYRNHK